MPQLLVRLAWLNVVVHILGLILAAVAMRPGSPLVPLRDRLDYLAQAPPLWTCAWATWMICAAALIAFLAALTYRLGVEARLAQLGLMIVVAGGGFDLFCDSIYILVFPKLAASPALQEASFLMIERVTGIASLVIANGAYAVGILLIVTAMRGRPGLVRFTTGAGYGVAGGGLLLAAAGFTGVPEHALWATPPTMGLFCIWVLLVAYSVEPAGRSS
jgi:hypothetical protein